MIDTAFATAFVLIFIRLFSYFVVVPVFFPKGTSSILKAAFSAILAFILLPGVNSSIAYSNSFGIIIGSVCEVITGITLGYLTNLIFYSARLAGDYIDIQIGFSMINLFDPNLNSNSTLIDHLMYWLSTVLFFIVNGHLLFIKSLTNSFFIIEPGRFILYQQSAMAVMKIFIDFFTISFKIAFPIVLIVLITDLTMALVSRTVPQINVMVLGLPVKILVGLAGFSLMLPLLAKAIIYNINSLPNIFNNFYKVIPFAILIFASEDKTEEATSKKKSDARKKGQVAKSKDIDLAMTLLACTLIISMMSEFAFNSLKSTMSQILSSYLNNNLNMDTINGLMYMVIKNIVIVVLPAAGLIMAFGVAANFLQTGFLLTSEPLKMDLAKLNPINGFKRIFSMRSVIQLLKDTAIVSIVGYVGYKFIMGNYEKIFSLINVKAEEIPEIVKSLIISIFFKITLVMIIIALIDFLYQKFQYSKDLKMTKQEVKEEYKQTEGDPQIKGKIRQRQREISTKRMMQQVPKATVVVTNPTHIAIVLKYVEGEDEAPMVVAKGLDFVAQRIKEVARDNEVPIIENKPLARLLYAQVEIDEEIPADLYQAVAEILAMVMKLKKRK